MFETWRLENETGLGSKRRRMRVPAIADASNRPLAILAGPTSDKPIEVVDSDGDDPPPGIVLQQAQSMELDTAMGTAGLAEARMGDIIAEARVNQAAPMTRAEVKEEPKPWHPKCTSAEDCVGRPESKLILHVLEGLQGDVYCERCFRGFLSDNPTFQGQWVDGPQAGQPYGGAGA